MRTDIQSIETIAAAIKAGEPIEITE